MKINAIVEIDENKIIRQMQITKEAADKFMDELLELREMMNVETPKMERERRDTERSLLIEKSVNDWCRKYQEQMKGNFQVQRDISGE